ncbi:hypothetical protein [Sphingosinithalassobacter sp. LHW66-3]|uniref:hypothetical protein n=1 Tax=Sphingosinithalassobacter sp. LHW66-3 TaxID=3424718 RepID=UPI003D6C34A7
MMILSIILAAIASPGSDSALSEWRSCVRTSAAQYARIVGWGEPQQQQSDFVEGQCWKARALAVLALEPVVLEMMAEEGVTNPSVELVGLVIKNTVDRERDRVLSEG